MIAPTKKMLQVEEPDDKSNTTMALTPKDIIIMMHPTLQENITIMPPCPQ